MKEAEDSPGQDPGEWAETDKDKGRAGDTGAWSWEIAPEGRGGACSDAETVIGFHTRRALENLAGSFLVLQWFR